MLRHITKTVGSSMATLCLVSTLAMAQSQSSTPPIPQGQNPTVYQEQTQYPSQSEQYQSPLLTELRTSPRNSASAQSQSIGIGTFSTV